MVDAPEGDLPTGSGWSQTVGYSEIIGGEYTECEMRNKKTGETGLRAVFLPTVQGFDLVQLVGAFTKLVDDVTPGKWCRGQDVNENNYMTIDPTKANQQAYDKLVLGEFTVTIGGIVMRIIVYSGSSNMTRHWDSKYWYPDALIMLKLGGKFSRGGDDFMDKVELQYSGVWAYAAPAAAFHEPRDGGWGAKHAAGGSENAPAISIKVMTQGNEEVPPTVAVLQVLSQVILRWELSKVRLVHLCARAAHVAHVARAAHATHAATRHTKPRHAPHHHAAPRSNTTHLATPRHAAAPPSPATPRHTLPRHPRPQPPSYPTTE